MATHALNRHLVLAGFMGAGKTTLGRDVARRLGRPFVDLDREIEREAGSTIEDIFARDGESGFRLIEAGAAASALDGRACSTVLGGAVLSDTRDCARGRSPCCSIDPETQRARESPAAGD